MFKAVDDLQLYIIDGDCWLWSNRVRCTLEKHLCFPKADCQAKQTVGGLWEVGETGCKRYSHRRLRNHYILSKSTYFFLWETWPSPLSSQTNRVFSSDVAVTSSPCYTLCCNTLSSLCLQMLQSLYWNTLSPLCLCCLARSGSKQLQPLSTSTDQEAKTLLRNSQRSQRRRATGDYNPSTCIQTQSTVKDPSEEGPLETTAPLHVYRPSQQSKMPAKKGHWRLQPLYMYTDPVNSRRCQRRRATGDYSPSPCIQTQSTVKDPSEEGPLETTAPLHVYRPSQQSKIPAKKGHWRLQPLSMYTDPVNSQRSQRRRATGDYSPSLCIQTQSTVKDPSEEGPLETTAPLHVYRPSQQSKIPAKKGHWRLQPLYMYTDPVNSQRSQRRRATGDYSPSPCIQTQSTVKDPSEEGPLETTTPLHVYRPSQQSKIPAKKGHWRLQPLSMYTDPVNSQRSQRRRATGDYSPSPCIQTQSTVKDPSEEGPLETTTPLHTPPTVWQDVQTTGKMCRPLARRADHWQDVQTTGKTCRPLARHADHFIQVPTGHCSLQVHRKQTGTVTSALCDCKEAEQTVHHILQDCPIWWQQRHQLWLQDESTTTRLWGMAETCATPPHLWQHVDTKLWAMAETCATPPHLWQHVDPGSKPG